MTKKEVQKKKMISFTPRIDEMIKEIQEQNGYATQAAVINQAIVEMHRDTFKYIPKKDKSTLIESTGSGGPTSRLNGIIAQLGGTVIEKPDGSKVVSYFTYTHKKRFENVVPISQISEQLLEAQYSPSKEIVLKLQADGKVNY